ncbi:MAG: CHAT domain-containing protein [Nostoc sp.]|uniref:CHAT domain-containing protein n=1 Tax=Nostoc sp. TaxID=1180 RepID=UPI002FFC9823
MNSKFISIRNLIQSGDLQNAISHITEITNAYSSRYRNEVILHTANLKELLENERKGILSIEEIRREKNRIVYALLNLINEIEQEIATKKDNQNKIANTINQDKIIKIIFLAANPLKTTHLKLDQESRSIDQALRQSEFRDKFEVTQHWAVRVSELQEILLRHKPDIVHFSGHGSQSSEIILQDNSDNSHPVSVRALSQLFSILKDNIRCVVMNACYSEAQAKAIAQHIDSVVGMSKAIKDDSAISFATSFYQALGYGRDVKTAFDLGCVQIDMENLDEQHTPQLLALKCSPTTIFFKNDI